ncbi:hypothetical protein A7985_09610 [Pseudoalteromonas luteoviolacea]|uniref:Uncharacterized protein n=1 Tax=Pseudoalteromonas luteoviolacea TaxID=43657 RepID=A0A1C0TS05_9GAMM|nr:hypothetical protein [Pseudoalteromonas luteoviolacea]OCQ22048.1 hypothetical protein A7985_09610 [Pseudoalteromonas luteoviolacea]
MLEGTQPDASCLVVGTRCLELEHLQPFYVVDLAGCQVIVMVLFVRGKMDNPFGVVLVLFSASLVI